MKRVNTKRLSSLFGALVLIAGVTVQLLPPVATAAAVPEFGGNRSLTLEPGDEAPNPTGGSTPGSGTPNNVNYQVKHKFSFTLGGTTSYNISSLSFQYCTTAEPVAGGTGCVQPTGLDLTNAQFTASGQTGVTSFGAPVLSKSVDASDVGATNNVMTVSLATPYTLTGATPVTYEFKGIQNPSTANTTFFVRILAFDNTSTAIEGGTVAASTTQVIQLSGDMPESLVFCTGGTISKTNNVPDCTTASSGSISFNQLFSPTSTAFSTSQMAASTNAGNGYAITVFGPTLTSGTNNITAIGATAGNSEYGVSQFGLNLVKNDGSPVTAYPNPPVISGMPVGYSDSANVDPAAGFTPGNYTGGPATNFDADDEFTFNPGTTNTVANSTAGSDPQIYTVSYIVNVPGSQPAGTYTTTLTYVCTATF